MWSFFDRLAFVPTRDAPEDPTPDAELEEQIRRDTEEQAKRVEELRQEFAESGDRVAKMLDELGIK